MEAYIEYVILDNISMNYIILNFIDLTTGIKIAKINKSIVCILGTVLAIFLPYLYFNKVLLFGYKILVSIILVMCIKRFHKFKSFLCTYMLFVIYTFLLGGVCYGVISLMGIDYTMSSIMISSFEFPVGFVLVIIVCMIRLIFGLIVAIKNKLRSSNYIYKISIIDGDKSVSSFGFLDTGNNVMVDGKGVSIISLSLFLKLYNDIDVMDIILKKENIKHLKHIQYIQIRGIGNEENYLSFVVDGLNINGKMVNYPRMALTLKNFGDHDCILSGDIIKGGV